METADIRHMHNLFRSKIISVFFFLMGMLFASNLSAQITAKDNFNYKDFQKKNYYFGISPLGTTIANFRVDRSSQFMLNDSINVVESRPMAGYAVNLIGNIKIGEYFDFRFLPGFAFLFRELTYESDTRTYSKSIESVNLEFPMLLRFKSAPYRDKRLFVIGGVKYSYDVSSNSKITAVDAVDLVQISPHDFSLELGAGMQFFFPYFILSPEIKVSQGVGNIHIFKRDLNESAVLDQLLSRVLQISFHFEG